MNIEDMIRQIELHPIEARNVYQIVNQKGLLDTPIRDGAWTPRQIFHHLVDSHINNYIRIKLAITENTSTIKAYNEALWAELDDVKDVPVETSLSILNGIHKRSVSLLKSLLSKDPSKFDCKLHHPEVGSLSLQEYLQVFADHGAKHLAAIKKLYE
jgi:hypothetical protein